MHDPGKWDGGGRRIIGRQSQHGRAETNAAVWTNLGRICVWPAIGHGEETGTVVAKTEVLVWRNDLG